MKRNYYKSTIAAIAVAIVLSAQMSFAQFRETRQLTSNNVVALAGSGDTLWLATERGFNYRTSINNQGGWSGFEVNDLARRFCGLAFGGGGAAALVYEENISDQIGFWSFDHAGGKQRQTFFRFPRGVRGEYGDMADPTGSIVYARGNFWAAFNNGGIVRYDPRDGGVYAIRPGDADEALPQDIAADDPADQGLADSRRVLSLDVFPADNRILVTTASTLWAYDPGDKSWDTLYSKPELPPPAEFVSYNAAFVVGGESPRTPLVYSFAAVKRGGAADTALYVSDYGSDRWFGAVSGGARFNVSPAVNGAMYAVYSDNRVSLLADTSADGGARENLLSEILTPADFRRMLADAGDIANPEVNDILFMPRGERSGTLAAATTTGLYICESAEPLAGNYGGFTLHRYVRGVKAGEAYALPGVVRGGMGGRYGKCVFVYKLKKDGDVTIRVYDYNMSLVKTVVKGARRGSKAERSTDPARDFWNGTNESGRRAWPGVYYFKITSTGGDRLFGKIILAK